MTNASVIIVRGGHEICQSTITVINNGIPRVIISSIAEFSDIVLTFVE